MSKELFGEASKCRNKKHEARRKKKMEGNPLILEMGVWKTFPPPTPHHQESIESIESIKVKKLRHKCSKKMSICKICELLKLWQDKYFPKSPPPSDWST